MAESLIRSPWAVAIDPAVRDGRVEKIVQEAGSGARTVPLPEDLDPGLAGALEAAGIVQLYSHQAEVFSLADDSNVVITTATASGKSLAFNLPVLNALAGPGHSTALYLYPTKALAQDQARSLGRLAPPGLRYAIYDGDTPKGERPAIRKNTDLVLTNPDMLHLGILPHHGAWGTFFSRLDWVVIDEAHTYRGVFGSNVANVIRRLRRLAAAYGSSPRFLLASATIANPVELAERLVGDEFTLVSEDGAPRSPREVVVWNPPLIDPGTGTRRSPLAEAADLLADLACHGIRTICFLKSRRGIELIRKFTAERLEAKGRGELADRIAPYRAGYTPAQRREIEADLVEGRLLGVVATDALELGLDIGELDAAICVTFPGTTAGLRQMWGRAGRRREGLAVYIAGQDGLDQYFCRHPDEFLGRPVEAAILDHASPEIAAKHLLAAAYEMPVGPGDEKWFGPEMADGLRELETGGAVRRTGSGCVPRDSGFVASRVSLRSSSRHSVDVIDAGSGEVIGEVESGRALSTVHPGAVYMHLGRSWEVKELDLENERAIVTGFDGEWYTRPRIDTEIFIDRTLDERATSGVALSFGRLSVSETVTGFERILSADQSTVDLIELELPTQEFGTRGLWYVPDAGMVDELPLNELLGTLHATEHAQIAVLPLIAMCDRWDIGGLSTNVHAQTGDPTVFIYDGHPGGIGITARGFAEFERLVADALRLVSECGCETGCPACVQSPKCGNLNDHLYKRGSAEFLEAMAASESSRS
jgi:DEAD/DEAH box helicase domain-containing protein